MALTKAQVMLIEGAGEAELTRFVKSRARHWHWEGVHVRYSQGVLESVHRVQVDGYSEALGMPDWVFWSETRGQSFYAELKGVGGRLRPEQKRTIPSLRLGGQTVFEWWPKDAEFIEAVFEHGLAV